jgi:protein-L-isoaspartate(D-aspartate) O-methyltransferase
MGKFAQARLRMVEEQVVKRGVKDPAVIEAMGRVQRHRFVDESLARDAYKDKPLPIGYSQTISQPYIVALMSETLRVQPGDRVLEIGTGSGYQAAVLAEMGISVFSIERNPTLGKRARRLLDTLGYQKIATRVGDGTYGWREYSPFKGIIVTAGAPLTPSQLMDQLTDGGRLVVPVGTMKVQQLKVYEKQNDTFVSEDLGNCLFVPLIGAEGWSDNNGSSSL